MNLTKGKLYRFTFTSGPGHEAVWNHPWNAVPDQEVASIVGVWFREKLYCVLGTRPYPGFEHRGPTDPTDTGWRMWVWICGKDVMGWIILDGTYIVTTCVSDQ